MLGCLIQYTQDTATITAAIREHRAAKAAEQEAKRLLEQLERTGGDDAYGDGLG